MTGATLVTGAGRGLGLELTRQCLERGDRVVATARRPGAPLAALGKLHGDRLTVLTLDVGDEVAIGRGRHQLEGQIDGIALLINNAGMYSHQSARWDPSATGLDTVTSAELVDVFRVNSVGPMLMVKYFLELLAAGRARVLNVSSLMGSVSQKTGPGDYAYAASKAALNIMTRALAAELAPRGIVVVAITPGWVRTDMGGSDASLSPEESVRGMLAVAARLTPADTGRFVDYAGVTQPW